MDMALALNATNMDVVAENQQLASIFQQFSASLARKIASYQISPYGIKLFFYRTKKYIFFKIVFNFQLQNLSITLKR